MAGQSLFLEKIVASGKKSGEAGGTVKILGTNVALIDKASIDVSGDSGGGEVLIGGNAHGAGPEMNADHTYFGSDVTVNANALTEGNGGNVIVWSDLGTQFYGNILAQGGTKGGNGGWVETSGQYLDTAGASINLSALKGQAGTWLLDPADLTISTAATANPAPFTANYTADNNSNTSNVNITDLSNALATGNVVIQTTAGGTGTGTGNITVANAFSWSSANSLTLSSINNIFINAAVGTGATGSQLILNMAGSGGTQTGVISGSGTLVKQGIGTFTLSQANTYTGGTIVNGGKLNASVLVAAGSQVGTGGITINNGSIFSYTGATATAPVARTFTIGAGGGTIQGNSATGATLTISGGIAIGGNALTIDTIGATPANITIATNPISGAATGSSLTKTGAGTLTINSASTYGSSSSATTINGGTLANGVTNALPTTTALTVGSSGTYNLNNVAQTIGSLSGSGIVRNTGAASRILTVGDASSTTFSGTLGNAGGLNFGLTKQGAGTLTLSGISAYTGATLISAGVLQAGASNVFSNASDFTVTGTLDMNNFAQSIGSLAGAGTVSLSQRLTAGADNASTAFSGLLNGSGGLTKTGTGTLTLSGAVAGYTGITNINAGTVAVTTNANALGTGAVNITPTGATASTLSITNLSIANALNLDSTNASVTLSGTGTQTYSGLISLTGTNNTITNSGTITLSNVISGSGGFTRAGTGTTILSALNTYAGKTSVSAGTLSINSIADVGGGSSALGAPTTLGNGTIDLAGTLIYTGSGNSSNRVINLTGASILSASGSGALTLSGGVTGAGQNLTLTGAGAGTESGSIATTTGTLSKLLAGTWTLAGANTYTGGTTISAGTLNVTNTGGLGNASGGAISLANNTTLGLNLSGGTLADTNSISLTGSAAITDTAAAGLTDVLNNAITIAAAGTPTITSTNATAGLTLTGGITNNGTSLTLTGAGDGTISGGIISGSGALIKSGAGTFTLSSANNYSGATTVSGTGILKISNATGLGTSAAGTTINSGATLQINGVTIDNEAITINNGATLLGTGTATLGSTLGNSPITLAGTLGTSRTIATLSAGDVFTLNGAINGGAVLALSGPGTLNLNSTVGNTTSLSSVTSTGTGTVGINGGSVSTTGSQTYNSIVSLGQNTVFTGGNNQSIQLLNTANNFTAVPTFTASTGKLTTVALVNASSNPALPVLSPNPTNLLLNFSNAAIVLPGYTLTGTLTVTAGGHISQSGALVITGVSTINAGTHSINLSNAGNNFSTIALSGNNANITDLNGVILAASTLTGNLTVTAGGTITDSGVISANTVTSSSVGGTTLDATGGATANIINNFNATNSGSGVITLVDNTPTLTVTGISQTGTTVNLTNTGTLAVADGAGITTNNTAITILAKDLNLNSTGFINSGTQTTTIGQSFAGGSIGLGNATGTMSISGAELQRITANNLSISTTTSNGQISVDGVTATNNANINTVNLTASGTAGAISFNNNASTFNALTATAANGITVNTDLTTAVGGLTLTANTAGALILNGVNLSSGTTLNLAGTSPGGVQLTGSEILTAGTNFTLNSPLTGAYDFTVNANGGATINRGISIANLFINTSTIGINGANPITTTGDQTYTASNTMDIGGGVTMTGRNITFNTPVTGGGQDLILNGQTGTDNHFVFNGTVGVNNIIVTGNATGSNELSVDVARNDSWLINGANQGSITNTGVTGAFTFSNIGNVTGGINDDTFTFNNGSTLSGIVNGGAGGSNILDLAQYTTASNIALTGSTAFGYAGTTSGTPNPSGGFSNMTQINGAASGSPINTVTGENTANSWTITGSNSGTVNDGTATLAFANFANLTGGSGNDTFSFNDGDTISGVVNGGAGGSNILDFSPYTTATNVALTGSTSFGYTGNTSGVVNPSSGFSNISQINGAANGPSINTLTAENTANSWTITGSNSGIVNDGIATLAFANFANLTGGSGSDVFVVNDSGSVATLDGGSGINSLSYLGATTPVNVNLLTNTATRVNSFSNITNFVGDDGTTGTNATLIATNANNNWSITAVNAGSINANTYTFSGFGNLTGGTNDDTFTFDNGTKVTGLIDGTNLASINTLNYLLYTTPVKVTLFTPTSGDTQNTNGEFITHFININNILENNPSPPIPPTPPIPPPTPTFDVTSLVAGIVSSYIYRADTLYLLTENIDPSILIVGLSGENESTLFLCKKSLNSLCVDYLIRKSEIHNND